MSVVANVVSTHGSWIVSDGRAREGSEGKILSESATKALLVNSEVCIGYTGTLETATALLQVLHSPENAKLLPLCCSDDIARSIQGILAKSTIPDHMKNNFLISGKNRAGAMVSYTVSRDGELTSYIPDDDNPLKFIVLSTGKHQLSLPQYILAELKEHGSLPGSGIISAMKRFCCDVADRDPSVNKNLSVIELRA